MQDRLEDQISADPQSIIEEFETAVRREAPPDDPQEKDIALGQMLRAFRSATPAKENPIYVRMIETLLVVYHHQRNGRATLESARVDVARTGGA